ncbi:MAG: hypothetical protein M3Y56_13780 [Armatimonadota bacterium]|nr:hypothetical protein [Armatimonadota bacterium]
MRRAENKDIARLMFASITRPINAALTGAGTLFAVAGMTSPAHTLGFVGAAMLVGTLGLVGRDLSNKDFIQEVLTEGEPMKALPEIPESLAGQYRLHCLEAKRHLEKTTEAMESSGPEMAEELTPIREQIMEHVESVYRLAARAHHLDGALSNSSRNEINKEIEKIKAQMVIQPDPVSNRHLQRTLEQKQDQLTTYDELALRVRRIQAQMQSINATLDNVQTKVLKIVTSDLKSGSSQTDELSHNLQSMLEEVKSFEKSLDYTLSSDEDPSLPPPGSLESWDMRAGKGKQLSAGDELDQQRRTQNSKPDPSAGEQDQQRRTHNSKPDPSAGDPPNSAPKRDNRSIDGQPA